MTDNVKSIVDLAMADKPNKASEVLDDILRDRLAGAVQQVKNELSNEFFGQEYQGESDAEPVEVQQELDLDPQEEEEVEQDELVDDEGEVEETEEPDQDEDPDEDEEENENT